MQQPKQDNKSKQKQQRNKQNFDTHSQVFGKVPPQATDIETAILGAIMLERNALDVVLELLTPEVFYKDTHQMVFRAMIALNNKSQPIDILTVSEHLRSTGELEAVGGSYYITTLTNAVVSSANIETHARIVYQKFIQRELIHLGSLLINDGYEDLGDVFEMIDEAEKALFAVTNSLHKKNYVSVDGLLVKAITEINAIRLSNQALSGVSSGFPSIDRITHGWQKTDLIILAARPGVGKTALALNLARNAALDPIMPTPVAFFSLEMSAGQLIRRLMSSESQINLEKLQRGRLEEDDMKQLYAKAVQKLANAKIFIDDTGGLNVFELRAKCRRLKTKENIGLIIVDYLQLMSGTAGHGQRNREGEISEISRNLKKLAKELDIPIIALSQLSRETEKRTNKEPQLSDLRESGAIEQDADAVIFIFRPEYYGMHRGADGESNPGETHLKFAKYRNGSPGTAKLRAQLWIQKFVEMEETFGKKGGVDFKKKAGNDVDKEDGITKVWKAIPEQLDIQDETFK